MCGGASTLYIVVLAWNTCVPLIDLGWLNRYGHPVPVSCSKDFVCNRRRHSSRSQRASLSLGIRFEADNVIVLRGESPQSSLGRASASVSRLCVALGKWNDDEGGERPCGTTKSHQTRVATVSRSKMEPFNCVLYCMFFFALFSRSLARSPRRIPLDGR